jgi:hypothetical protein
LPFVDIFPISRTLWDKYLYKGGASKSSIIFVRHCLLFRNVPRPSQLCTYSSNSSNK